MNYLAIIELNLVVCVLCYAIFSENRKSKTLDFLQDKQFNHMLFVMIALLLIDTLSWILTARKSSNFALHWATETGYFVCQVIMAMLLLRYCMGVNKRRVSDSMKILLQIPVAITLAILAVNLFHPFVFHILPDNSYQRMDYFMVLNIWPMVYITAALLLCLVRFFRGDPAERDLHKKLLIFTGICVGAGIFGILLYGTSIWPIIVLGLLYLYLNVHNKREDELVKMASRDGLTGLGNTLAYRRKMQSLEERIQDGSAAFAVVVIDINGLKNTNDQYGHNAGDRLILQISKLICETFMHSPVFRTGGDEFVVLLENADFQNRTVLMQRFREAIASATFDSGRGKVPLSAAAGMADFEPEQNMRYVDVYEAADKRMYADKSCACCRR